MTQPQTPTASGRREQRGDLAYVVLERTFTAPLGDIWAAVTEPEKLERWIGTWSGNPDDGTVAFRMTAEGENAPEETIEILACEPPRRLELRSRVPGESSTWIVTMNLVEAAGVTTLTFAQSIPDPATAESMGPGWDYYLDRLVCAAMGEDVAAVVWDAYYPALAEHYRAAFA